MALIHEKHTMSQMSWRLRWYWSIKLPEGGAAALPSFLALAVEKHVCAHRRERKVLFVKKPASWKDKLVTTNAKVMTVVVNSRESCLATAKFLKTSTTIINGKTEFLGKGRHHELLRIHFELSDSSAPEGPGAYFLSSKHYEKRELVCVSASAQRNGYDLLKEHYAGRVSNMSVRM